MGQDTLSPYSKGTEDESEPSRHYGARIQTRLFLPPKGPPPSFFSSSTEGAPVPDRVHFTRPSATTGPFSLLRHPAVSPSLTACNRRRLGYGVHSSDALGGEPGSAAQKTVAHREAQPWAPRPLCPGPPGSCQVKKSRCLVRQVGPCLGGSSKEPLLSSPGSRALRASNTLYPSSALPSLLPGRSVSRSASLRRRFPLWKFRDRDTCPLEALHPPRCCTKTNIPPSSLLLRASVSPL